MFNDVWLIHFNFMPLQMAQFTFPRYLCKDIAS